MMTVRGAACVVLAGLLGAWNAAFAAEGVTLSETVSREHPSFRIARSSLAVGLDGKVYLVCDDKPRGYIMRIEPDGTGKTGSLLPAEAVTGVAANAQGIIATSHAHFAHRVCLMDPDFKQIGMVNDFLVNDDVQWDSPSDVQAGPSGDFYAFGANRNRIVRIAPPGRLVTTCPLGATGDDYARQGGRFRVWEEGRRFYVANQKGQVHALDFEGRKLWTIDARPAAFDADAQGRLFLIAGGSETVRILGPDGRPEGMIKLDAEARQGQVGNLCVRGDRLFLKRDDPAELFRVYDVKSGALVRAVKGEVERLTVRLPSDVWTAGARVPLDIEFDPGRRKITPAWRVTLSPLNTPERIDMPVADGAVVVAANAAGVYRMHLGWDQYDVRCIVGVQAPGARGSVSVLTPGGRIYYGWGEEIPVSVVVRTVEGAAAPETVALRLTDGAAVVAERRIEVKAGEGAAALLSREAVRALRPGPYWLVADAEGLTSVPQMLRIGRGVEPAPAYSIVQHGDYTAAFTVGSPWEAPEAIRAYLDRSLLLGTNLYVDRLGHGAGAMPYLFANNVTGAPLMRDVRKMLAAQPTVAAEAKADFEPSLRQMIAAYGACGIEQQAILLYMDAGLPLGTGYDKRTPEQMTADLKRVSEALKPYPAFRGWSWAANWWIAPRGAKAARTPDEQRNYEEAMERARNTGAWDPIIEQVSDIWVNYAVDAERLLDAALQDVAPGKISAMTAPYRQPGIIPPITFRNADEVDLHLQAEQIQPPQVPPHNVDFYKRPGKRAWGHPELWNDSGTGEMVFALTFQMLMRGADGTGWSGAVPHWGSGPVDPRSTGLGAVSVYRTMNHLLAEYGPWHTALSQADPVVIPVSTRMMRMETAFASSLGGFYFERLYEAYQACLYAHRPARFLFVEDMKPESLTGPRAVLLVSQTVEMEPRLAEALDAAARAGVPIFCDATCRDTLVKGFRPVGAAFDQVEKERHPINDDSVYDRLTSVFLADAAKLDRAFGDAVPPIARTANPQVLLTERRGGDGRFLWVVNNTMPPLSPGQAWRVGLLIGTRMPVLERVGLQDAGSAAVYDVFAQRRVQPEEGAVAADLRSVPARLYALLPRPIGRVVARGPAAVQAGEPFEWDVEVQADDGQPLRAVLPVRVRLLDARGGVLDERFTAAPGKVGADRPFRVPVNAEGAAAVLEASELVSGRSAALTIAVGNARRSVEFGAVKGAGKPVAAASGASGADPAPDWRAPADRFGPHLRDVAVARDGAVALVSAMNWDQNLYALDLADGRVRWRGRVGHHFAYGPVALPGGFAVQGYDLESAEGYHLYLLDEAGKVDRRFALYGLPGRATLWLAGHLLVGEPNQFAAAGDGSWVAAAGGLGLAVWDRSGKLLWSRDWWKDGRRSPLLLGLGSSAVLTLEGRSAAAWRARDGAELWQAAPCASGKLVRAAASRGGETVALAADERGGRIYIVRDGKVANTLYCAADELALAPDGAALAVLQGATIRWFSAGSDIQWSAEADERLRGLEIAPDGRRVAAGSETGFLSVWSADGALLHREDLGSIPKVAWLADGGLLAVTWMGEAVRLDAEFRPVWHTRPRPDETDVAGKLLRQEAVPTVRMDGWGNASKEAAPLRPNLLVEANARLAVLMPRPWPLEHPEKLLYDGSPEPPDTPWVSWSGINYIDSGWYGSFEFNVDLVRSYSRVTAITMVEDPKHPESWLRDLRLQYWDAEAGAWQDGPYLLSNQPVHTHVFARPIEASRFRFVAAGSPGWPVGSVRLGELVFHGEVLGSPHPDVIGKRGRAVLFDEGDPVFVGAMIQGHNPGLTIEAQGAEAYSGGHFLKLGQARGYGPHFVAGFGHVIENWDFRIAENPKPGEYRWLQFAWRGLSEETTGIALRLYGDSSPGIELYAGRPAGFDRAVAVQVDTNVPRQWKVVRVDLWRLMKEHHRLSAVTALGVGAVGGPAAIDQIVLGRTEEDLGKLP